MPDARCGSTSRVTKCSHQVGKLSGPHSELALMSEAYKQGKKESCARLELVAKAMARFRASTALVLPYIVNSCRQCSPQHTRALSAKRIVAALWLIYSGASATCWIYQWRTRRPAEGQRVPRKCFGGLVPSWTLKFASDGDDHALQLHRTQLHGDSEASPWQKEPTYRVSAKIEHTFCMQTCRIGIIHFVVEYLEE
ncbi:hypothetical protein BKA63DRAFT_75850 [Paraphoma chrysanthemicola]|nr:hypothetical protein BKA63DRAFT_75850 [Paraphoma chrysanthemicola]